MPGCVDAIEWKGSWLGRPSIVKRQIDELDLPLVRRIGRSGQHRSLPPQSQIYSARSRQGNGTALDCSSLLFYQII